MISLVSSIFFSFDPLSIMDQVANSQASNLSTNSSGTADASCRHTSQRVEDEQVAGDGATAGNHLANVPSPYICGLDFSQEIRFR